MKPLVVLALAPVIIALNALVDGYVMMKLWAWYIAEPFKAPGISIALGLGFSLIVAHLAHQSHDEDHGDPWKAAERILGSLVLRPGLILLVGYIVKSCFFVGVR